MSLEDKIEQLTFALDRLSVEMRKAPYGHHNYLTQIEDPSALEPGPDEQKKSRETSDETPKSTSATSEKSELESKPGVTYEGDVKPITLEVSKLGRDKIIATLGRFGVKKAQDLAQGQWEDYIAYAKKVVSGDIDPEASA